MYEARVNLVAHAWVNMDIVSIEFRNWHLSKLMPLLTHRHGSGWCGGTIVIPRAWGTKGSWGGSGTKRCTQLLNLLWCGTPGFDNNIPICMSLDSQLLTAYSGQSSG